MTGQEAAERTAHATHVDALYRDCRLCIGLMLALVDALPTTKSRAYRNGYVDALSDLRDALGGSQ